MEKIKKQGVIYFLLIAIFAIAFQSPIYGQDYLSKEREIEIKTSGNYYWGEGSDFIEDLAKASASAELSTQIIQDAVGQSEQVDEILKTIDAGAHLDRIPQQGKVKILAWIPKDSVLLTVAVQRPITQLSPEPQPVTIPVTTNNPALQQLAACKTYEDVKRVATMNGFVRGEFSGGSKGFSNPENCIIAVFTADGMLSALLDTGDYSRNDLISGNKIQNPEQYFSRGEYYLWYMQAKKTISGEAGEIQKVVSQAQAQAQQNTRTQVQNNNKSTNNSLQAPPIENTKSYANASVRLPKDWDGKSILANGFVWIFIDDIKLQNKYNVHPGDEYYFSNDYETWDDDNTYYKYPLSPNVVIEAGVWKDTENSDFSTRKMTVNEFANYMRSQNAVEGKRDYGITTNVTYKNGMITKIKEVYTP